MRVQFTPIVTGEYSPHGYEALVNGQLYYSAGNHCQDSAVSVSPSDPCALSLREIRRCCIKACLEIAEERHAIFGGVMRAKEEAA